MAVAVSFNIIKGSHMHDKSSKLTSPKFYNIQYPSIIDLYSIIDFPLYLKSFSFPV